MGRRKRHEQESERDGGWEPTAELQDKVYRVARRWSRDRPDYQEDLYQEGMLAIWLKGETEAPLNHQLRTAKHRMLSTRKLGKSVDGKLDYTYRRSTTYAVHSLEQEGTGQGDGLLPFQELLPSSERVEEYVIEKLTAIEILAALGPDERFCVILLCQGFTVQEVAARKRYPTSRVRDCLVNAREKLQALSYKRCRT